MQAGRTHFLAINAKGTMQFFLAFQNPKLSSNVHMKSITSNDFKNSSSLHLEMYWLNSFHNNKNYKEFAIYFFYDLHSDLYRHVLMENAC